MAFGDPMVFETLYNGDFESQSNFDSLLSNGTFDVGPIVGPDPPGWTASSSTGTFSLPSGTRTGGVGSNYYRNQSTAPGLGTVLLFYQLLALRGHRGLQARGHVGRTFRFRIWARNNGTGTVQIRVRTEFRKENLAFSESDQSTSYANLTSTWTLYTLNVSPTADLTAIILADIELNVTVDGNPDLQFDEADFYEYFTFLNRATVPDDPDFMVPGESFVRTVNNSLLAFGPLDAASARLRYQLNFGICGLEQLKSLRSFWLLRTPLRWQPNLPHLPTYIQCRIVNKSFPFAMHKSSFGANLYHGTLMLEEI